MSRSLPSLVSLTVAALVSCLPAQSEWPQFQANASHDGFIPILAKPGSMQLRWKQKLSTSSVLGVTIGEGIVFAVTTDKYLRAIDASTGSTLWSSSFTTANSLNPPSYAYGNVYVQTGNHSSDTYLRSFNARTGTVVFRAPHAAQWERYYAPTIFAGRVYVNGGSYGGMYSFDAYSGQQYYFTALPQYDQWTPAVNATTAFSYVGTGTSGGLYALDRMTGQQQYFINDPNMGWSGYSMNLAPVLGGKDDAFVVYAGRLTRFDLRNKTIAYSISGNFQGQPSIKEGVVYAVGAGELDARDQLTGQVLWSWKKSGDPLLGSVQLTSGHAFVRSASKTYMVDLATRTDVWSYAESGELSIGAGALFIAQTNGDLTSIGFAQLPKPTSVSPARAHFSAGPVPVTVKGTAFAAGGTPTVWFGTKQATNVVVVDDQTITCTTPASAAGIVDVLVENIYGRGQLDTGFAYFPAQAIGGTLQPGGVMRVGYECAAGDMVLSMISFPPMNLRSMVPFQGEIGLNNPYFLVFATPMSPFERFEYSLQIPGGANPVIGDLLVQGLAGRELLLGRAAFTNCATVRIQ